MVKEVKIYVCDVCGYEEKARRETSPYGEKTDAMPDKWALGYSKNFHICPNCIRKLSR